MDLEEREDWGELGGVEGEDAVVRKYCMRKDSLKKQTRTPANQKKSPRCAWTCTWSSSVYVSPSIILMHTGCLLHLRHHLQHTHYLKGCKATLVLGIQAMAFREINKTHMCLYQGRKQRQSPIVDIKSYCFGTGEMTQQLRALAALPES